MFYVKSACSSAYGAADQVSSQPLGSELGVITGGGRDRSRSRSRSLGRSDVDLVTVNEEGGAFLTANIERSNTLCAETELRDQDEEMWEADLYRVVLCAEVLTHSV